MYWVELMQTRGSKRGWFVRGTAGVLPRPGRSFGVLFGAGGGSVVQTTTVLSVDETDEAILFETVNSSYMLRILENSQ